MINLGKETKHKHADLKQSAENMSDIIKRLKKSTSISIFNVIMIQNIINNQNLN